jgi:hypothetical protein
LEEYITEKPTKEEEKVMEAKLKKDEIMYKLKYLEMQTSAANVGRSRIDSEILENYKPPTVLSREEHLALIERR